VVLSEGHAGASGDAKKSAENAAMIAPQIVDNDGNYYRALKHVAA